jgi:hypothetical protein
MSETPGTYYTGNSMSETPDTEELKCLALIEVMAVPFERREIALGTLRAIKERDEARQALMKIEELFIDGTDIYADREKMGMIARDVLEKIYEH